MFYNNDMVLEVNQKRDKVSSSKFEVFPRRAKGIQGFIIVQFFLKALHASFSVMVLMGSSSISHMEVIGLMSEST